MKKILVGHAAKAILLTVVTLCSPALPAQTFKVIYPAPIPSADPNALVEGSSNVFYGTTVGGFNSGSVVKITSSGTWTTLVSFNGSNGSRPRAGLVKVSDGSFYGTTSRNGTYGDFGTAFRVTTNGALTTTSFNGANGIKPYGALVQANDGNLYGTASEGGAHGVGTIFRLSLGGTLTHLFSFNTTNGATPYAGLASGSDGNLYGTTYAGGAYTNGTIFRVSTNGDLTTLVSFAATNGANPFGDLLQTSDGNLYGTTYAGGITTNGTIFKMTTNGELTTVVFFDGTNGAHPYAGLIQASDGNLYGSTYSGGTYTNGTIFRLTTNGLFTVLYSFKDTNGVNPRTRLFQGKDGSLYGTTYSNIFSLTPPPYIHQQPLGATISAGSALLSVQAAATTPFTYLWKRNGTNIAGATKSAYSATNVGQYQVVISNTAGAVVSSPAVVSYVSLDTSNALPRLMIQGPIGSQYRIDCTDDLTTNWSTRTNLTLTNSPSPYIDAASGNASNRFYRAVLMP